MERRKFVMGLGVLAAGSSAAVGSGAVNSAVLNDRTTSIDITTDQNSLIGLAPGNSEVVYQSEGGQLVVDFSNGSNSGSGVNPDSTYQIGNVSSDAVDAFENLSVNTGGPDVSTEDILQTAAMDNNGWGYAFKMMNQTTTPHDISLFYTGGVPDGMTVVLFGEGGGDTAGAASFAGGLPASSSDGNRLGGFPLPAGEDFYVSMLVATNNNASPEDSLNGSLTVRAGEDDEPDDPVVSG